MTCSEESATGNFRGTALIDGNPTKGLADGRVIPWLHRTIEAPKDNHGGFTDESPLPRTSRKCCT